MRALGHLRRPFLHICTGPPLCDARCLFSLRYNVASEHGRISDEDDTDRFQAVTMSGGMSWSWRSRLVSPACQQARGGGLTFTQRRSGSPHIRYELACHFRIDSTDHLKYTPIVYTSGTQNPTSINLSRHRRLWQRVLQLRSRRLPLRAGRRYSAPSFPPLHPRRYALSSHEESNARMVQDVAANEAYLAKAPKRALQLTTSVPPVSAPPYLTRYQQSQSQSRYCSAELDQPSMPRGPNFWH